MIGQSPRTARVDGALLKEQVAELVDAIGEVGYSKLYLAWLLYAGSTPALFTIHNGVC